MDNPAARRCVMAALLVVVAGSVTLTARATPEPNEAESAPEGRYASHVDPDAVVSSGRGAQAVSTTRQASGHHDHERERPPAPASQLDYEQLAQALEAAHATKPACAMRIIEADPVDQAIVLAITRPVDPAMVWEASCR